MPTKDPDKAASRFIAAVRRFQAGIHLERQRIIDARHNAPKLLPGEPHEVVDLTSVPVNDLDYYVYELGRLQDVAREMIKVFDSPSAVVDALERFDKAIPKLRQARNPLTHASDDARLDDVGSFSAVVRFLDFGKVEYLVDPRFQHHEAATALADELLAFLRARLRASPN
jgi:hypothetical protein